MFVQGCSLQATVLDREGPTLLDSENLAGVLAFVSRLHSCVWAVKDPPLSASGLRKPWNTL
jgi:hypothetical protein